MREKIKDIAVSIVEWCVQNGITIATAESCTGGSIAAAITGVAGCSAVYKGSVVAYSNEVKAAVLGVGEDTLALHGAVSEPVVGQMAQGVQRVMNVRCAVATSGIAGPGGGTPEKPVGTVWMAVAVGNEVFTRLLQMDDKGREVNIEHTVFRALSFLSSCVAGAQRG
ncbi:MAG: CinA family protein [Bacteroidaceae bacterium]|nr:CinA family protein [Bacteroidaceae bacterium]